VIHCSQSDRSALMRFSRISLSGAVVLAAFVMGCQSSHEKGVTSDYRTQWTTVMADPKTTTDAAEAILASDKLTDVKSSSTSKDGVASAKKADGTKVNVAIKKEGADSSEVSVTVGTMGDPALGAEYARRIKEKAEAK